MTDSNILTDSAHPTRVCRITLDKLRYEVWKMRVVQNEGKPLTPEQIETLRTIYRADLQEHQHIREGIIDHTLRRG